MIHIYKLGGDWVRDGVKYTVDVTSFSKLNEKISNGWFKSFEEMKESISEDGSDYEAELRAKIKALGGKAGGRSSIETLEKQLKELENGFDS